MSSPPRISRLSALSTAAFPVAAALMVALAAFASTGCAELLGAALQRPEVRVESVRFEGFTLDAVDLTASFRVDNPNSLGVTLDGFDYDFAIADTTVVDGRRREGLEIGPRSSGTIELPLAVRYVDLYRLVRELWDRREGGDVPYTLRTGFSFDLPVGGSIRVPVERRGTIDIPGR